MSPKRTIMVTWLAMLGVQTVGSVDSKHRLPAPKQYVSVGTLWAILFLLGETRFARTAAQLSVLVLLVASVVGPFGTRAISFLGLVAKDFAVPPPNAAPSFGSSGNGGSAPVRPSGPISAAPSVTPA